MGRRAARLLGGAWHFVEMDEALVRRLGMPITDFFAAHGEAAFRESESGFLAELARRDRQIISCGGGVAGTAESLQSARAVGTLVWLDTCERDLLTRRLGDPKEAERPALLPGFAAMKAADLPGYLRVEVPTILAHRRPFYSQADYVVTTYNLSSRRVATIVAAIARAV